MVMFNKYSLNQFQILDNFLELKKNKIYNFNNINFNFDFKKKIIRSFISFFFVIYCCTPYDYFIFLGEPLPKLIFIHNISTFIDIKEYHYFYKKFN